MKQIESIKEFGGTLGRYQHPSKSCHCQMTFSVYLPPQVQQGRVPVVYFLSGLTCTDDNARSKAGMQRYAAELGLALVMPDTSPRGSEVPDVADRYDLGQGAGFYVNATQTPWHTHYQMYEYVTAELVEVVEAHLPVIPGCRSIMGHSMGGHGALICALKNPADYRSVSAFSPIANPTQCDWGRDCFSHYLGEDPDAWQAYDATCLVQAGAGKLAMLVDQGTEDEFLAEYLYPQALQQACEIRHLPLQLRMQPGYDHSYHFVGSFVGEHLRYHAKALGLC